MTGINRSLFPAAKSGPGESELPFQIAAEGALVGIYVIQGGRFRYVNPTLANMLGCRAEDVVGKKNWLDFIHPMDRELVGERMRRRLDGDHADVTTIGHGLRADQHPFTFESRSSRVEWEGEPAVIGTIVDITQRVHQEQEIDRLLIAADRHRSELQQLASRLIEAREAERQWISQELHDGMGQALTAVSIDLVRIRRSIPPDVLAEIDDRLAEAESLVTQTLRQMRGLSLELRPAMLDDLGLVPTLRWYISRFGERTGQHAQLSVTGLNRRLTPDMEIALYRIVQEGLTNIARHAEASNVRVGIDCCNQEIHLTIKDDGRGFRHKRGEWHKGLGLLGIRERATAFGGRMEIDTSPAHGTKLTVHLPCNQCKETALDDPDGRASAGPTTKENLDARPAG